MSDLQSSVRLALEPSYRVERELDGGGMAWHLWSMGMPDSALAVLSRALRQNPLSSLLLGPAVAITLGERRTDLARTYCRRYGELMPAGAGCDAQSLVADGKFWEAPTLIRERSSAQGRNSARRPAWLQAVPPSPSLTIQLDSELTGGDSAWLGAASRASVAA